MFDCWKHHKLVLIFGNGGSHANWRHTVADYVKTAMVDGKRRLRAMCMSDNLPMLTALGNDMGYDSTFSFPLETYGRAGDLAAISCSGNSLNILKAAETAKKMGYDVKDAHGAQGRQGRPDGGYSHQRARSDNFGVIEDLHMSVGHITAQMFHNRLKAS